MARELFVSFNETSFNFGRFKLHARRLLEPPTRGLLVGVAMHVICTCLNKRLIEFWRKGLPLHSFVG